jgi:hypothetical protein
MCTCIAAAPIALDLAVAIAAGGVSLAGVIVKRSPVGIVLGGYFLGRFAVGLPLLPGRKWSWLSNGYRAIERWLCLTLVVGAFVAPVATGLALVASAGIWTGAQTAAKVRRSRLATWGTEISRDDAGPLAIEQGDSGTEEERRETPSLNAPQAESLFVHSVRVPQAERQREYAAH